MGTLDFDSYSQVRWVVMATCPCGYGAWGYFGPDEFCERMLCGHRITSAEAVKGLVEQEKRQENQAAFDTDLECWHTDTEMED